MIRKTYTTADLLRDLEDAHTRLTEAEETIHAIRSGAVDGIVVSGADGPKVFTLVGADHPYRVLVESMHEGAVTLAGDGTILYANQAWADLLATRLEQVIGQSIRECVHPEDLSTLESLFLRAREGAQAEMRLRTATGDVVVTLWSVTTVSGHEPETYCLIVTDLTEQRQRQNLAASEQFSRALFDHIQDAIVVCDAGERIYRTNRAGVDLLGSSPLSHLFHEAFSLRVDDRATDVHSLSRLATQPFRAPIEAQLRRPDGRMLDVLVRIQALPDQRGGHGGWVVTLSDITERKRAAQEFLKMSKLESIGVLAGGIAHDFNNLLTGLVGNLYLMKTGLTQESPLYRRVVESEKVCERAKSLTQQLLTFSRGGAPIKRIVDIGALLHEWTLFALRGSNVEPFTDIASNLWSVEADEGQLSQVINNLVINAKQAMPAGGRVSVRAQNVAVAPGDVISLQAGPYVRIVVQDEGVGIKPEHLSRVFDPFFTTKPKGTGLGLTTSYSIVQRHGGTLSLESTAGRGATASLYLPAVSRVEPAERRDETATVTRQGEGRRVLLMDDEPLVRDVATDLFTHLGHQIVCVPNGEEAAERYRKSLETSEPFDLVLLDLTVPGGMGGVEAVRRLLAIDPDVHAVVSSGYCDDPVMADFSQYGFRDRVTKPYQIDEIVEKVAAVKRRGA